MKPRLALAFVVPLALLGLALGVRAAWRERTRPGREIAAVEAARGAAQRIADAPPPALDALAARAHEDVLPPDALDGLPGLTDFAIVSLDPKERPIVWTRAAPSAELAALVRVMRGEETRGELAALGLKDPPARFERLWPHGFEEDRARVTVVLGRRRGQRAIVALCEARSAVVD